MDKKEMNRISEIAKQDNANLYNAKIELLKRENEVRKIYIEIIQFIKPVIEKFDQKVFNARFKNALSKKLEEFRLEKFYIYVEGEGRYIAISMPYYNEFFTIKYRKYGYFNEEWINDSLNIRNEKDSIYLSSNDCYFEDETGRNRINSKGILEACDKHIEYLESYIKSVEEDINRIDEMIQEAKQLEETFKKFNDKYNTSVKSLFDCSYRLDKNR